MCKRVDSDFDDVRTNTIFDCRHCLETKINALTCIALQNKTRVSQATFF
jgi:hypothetical protein